MGDFVEQTRVEPAGEGRYTAQLSPDWMLWGPAGGYVSAVALRAAGEATHFPRPVSYSCQYLRFAEFDRVELEVETLRAGRRSEALQVTMLQGGKRTLTAQVWASGEGTGMEHDCVPRPSLPDPETLPSLETLEDRAHHGFFGNFEQRPLDWKPEAEREPGEPEMRGFHRFRPRARAEDPFVDAARALILIDTFTWPATYGAHPGPSPWIAPNLDLYVRFHRDMGAHDWLFQVGRADLAEGGLIAAQGQVFSPVGELLASGATQLLCTPRPERFK